MKLLFSNFDSNLTIYRVCIQFVRSKKRQMFTIPPAQWMVCFVWHGKLSTAIAIKNWMQCTNWQQRFNTAITVHKRHTHTHWQESNENAGLNFDSSVLLSSSKINDFKLALYASLNCPAAAVVIYWSKENIALLWFEQNQPISRNQGLFSATNLARSDFGRQVMAEFSRYECRDFDNDPKPGLHFL